MARANGRSRRLTAVPAVPSSNKRGDMRSPVAAGGSGNYVLLTRVALVALPAGLYWDFGGVISMCLNAVTMCWTAVAPVATAAADLIAHNPPEAALAALITVWAISSASLLGRSGGRRRGFRHHAEGVHNLAKRIFRHSATPRPPPGVQLPRPGISFKLTPGPRIQLTWVTAKSEKSGDKPPSGTTTPTAPAATPLASPTPAAAGPSPPAAEPTTFAPSVYWPDLSFLPWHGTPPSSPKTQSTSGTSPHGIFTEFQRNMEHDLQRHNRHVHLSHSCSMPLLRSMHAPGPVSFECDIGSSDLDEIMESTPPAPAQPLPAVQPSGGPAPEGVMEALLSLTSTDNPQLTAAIPPSFFLQFASMLGDEPQALSALQAGGLPEGCAGPAELFGAESPDCVGKLWERLVQESCPGVLTYTAERRPLRRGIFMYRTVTVYEDACPREVRRFTLDDNSRARWDDNAIEHGQLPAPGDGPQQQENCFLYTRSKFPRPMAAREYLYARRVASRPDGGAYIVQAVPPAGGAHPPVPVHSGRGVRVADFTSCARIRPVPSPSGRAAGAVELAMIYFEDSQVRPGLMNMAVAKGLWPFVQRQEAAFRCYQSSLRRRSASMELSAAARPATAGSAAAAAAQPPAIADADAASASFLHAPPTWRSVPGDGWEQEDMPEVEFQSVSPKPGSRRARWKRRLFVAAVIARHIFDMVSD